MMPLGLCRTVPAMRGSHAHVGEGLPDFALNLARLMDRLGLNQSQLSRKTGVSQRHISALLRGESDCTLQIAEEIAKPFGLRGWQLMLPRMPDELIDSPRLSSLVESYIEASDEGRAVFDALAIRERRIPPRK